jgi:putative ABC transport system permease protein
MKLKDNIKVAFGSINDNKLRTVLTALIIAIGIMALVGILTSIDGMKKSINENFASMGANSYSIRNRGSGSIHIGGGRAKQKRFDNITYEQASDFKEKFTFPATVSVSSFASFAATVKFNSTKTNPNILIIASDANYLFTAGYKLAEGRNFSTTEQEFGTGVAIIGHEVKKTLFKNGVAEGNIISIGSDKFRVIGVLAEKGSSMGFGGDKVCIIPLLKGKQINTNPSTSYTITAMVNDGNLLSAAVSEGTGIFRNIRKLNTSEENNFQITQSDSLASSLIHHHCGNHHWYHYIIRCINWPNEYHVGFSYRKNKRNWFKKSNGCNTWCYQKTIFNRSHCDLSIGWNWRNHFRNCHWQFNVNGNWRRLYCSLVVDVQWHCIVHACWAFCRFLSCNESS